MRSNVKQHLRLLGKIRQSLSHLFVRFIITGGLNIITTYGIYVVFKGIIKYQAAYFIACFDLTDQFVFFDCTDMPLWKGDTVKSLFNSSNRRHPSRYVLGILLVGVFLGGCSPRDTASLTVTSWGPNATQAGVPFNVQPDNSAAFWVNVNQNLQLDAVMVFHGVKLHSVVSGKLVTAGVPADLYAQVGSYPLYVAEEVKGKEIISNTVYFVVHPK